MDNNTTDSNFAPQSNDKPTNHYKGMKLHGVIPIDVYDLENSLLAHHPSEVKHAIKKLIRVGTGAKSCEQDLKDALYSLLKALANDSIRKMVSCEEFENKMDDLAEYLGDTLGEISNERKIILKHLKGELDNEQQSLF